MKLARSFALLPVLLAAQAPDAPLSRLPYSPSLDTAFMDRSANPCDDFYRYACGNWIKLNPMPPDRSSWDVYSKLEQDNERVLWGILEKAEVPDAGRGKVEAEIGDFFQACMDEPAIERAGAAPLKPGLDEIAALNSLAALPAYVARRHLSLSGGVMFRFRSGQDFADSSREIAFAGAGGLGLPDRDYYLKTDAKSQEILQKYREHVARMLTLAGESPAGAAADAATAVSIETELARASLTRVERRNPYNLFHKMTPAQLQALTPSFSWASYLGAERIADTSVVNVTEPKFFQALDTQLRTRPLAAWKAYLRWHLVNSGAEYLSSRFTTADFDFYSHYLRGVQQMPPRWKRCVRQVDRDLGDALSQVFVARTFSPEMKQQAQAMTAGIEAAMEGEIRRLDWMSPETKQRAIEKLHTVVNKIGYPDRWRDYSSIRIARSDYYGDVERATAFETRRELNKIGKPVDRTEWFMTAPTVNAYYDPQMNDINFPAGVLQPPLFDPKMDAAPNYGDTGATIGHELTHGFDDEGRQSDAHGNLADWWTKQDAAEFEKRAACVSDQYSSYVVVDNIKSNGKLTLGEDVADLGGTFIAYLAWKNATAAQTLAPIDGLTPDQRFFIGMAQWACGDERPESKRVSAITDPHSQLEFRVNGVVSNLPEFQQAFACKAGQPMVREHRCKIW